MHDSDTTPKTGPMRILAPIESSDSQRVDHDSRSKLAELRRHLRELKNTPEQLDLNS